MAAKREQEERDSESRKMEKLKYLMQLKKQAYVLKAKEQQKLREHPPNRVESRRLIPPVQRQSKPI